MGFFMNLLWEVINIGLLAGFVALVLVMLRPLLVRVFTPQQRVVIWLVAWSLGHMPWLKRGAILPVTFQTLIVQRTGQFLTPNPAFLPVAYEGPGAYNLALPGLGFIEVQLNDMLVHGAMSLWLAVAAAICVFFILRGRKLSAKIKNGRLLEKQDPLLVRGRAKRNSLEGTADVWVSPGLPASFVRYRWDNVDEIVLQSELPQSQMELVLIHETQHVHLWHPWWKVMATINIVLFWWNPLVWLGYRYFCRDMELACDAAVLKRLPPEKRKEYAELLVELGSGRQLWEVPLAFGECDAVVRVKAAANWKPRNIALNVVTWCAAVCLMLFFYGGQRIPYPAADLKLAYEREYGGMEQFVEDLNLSMAQAMDLQPVGKIADCPDLGITQVWEAPNTSLTREIIDTDKIGQNMREHETGYETWEVPYKTVTVEYAALWVQTGDGTWYHVPYGWWGEGTNTFHVSHAEVCETPDLTGALRLI